MFGFTDYAEYRRQETEIAERAEERRRDRERRDAATRRPSDRTPGRPARRPAPAREVRLRWT